MTAFRREEAAMAMEGDGVEFRLQPIGGDMSVGFVRAPAGADFRPALAGLPGDLCQVPHWGYLLKGRLRMHTDDDPEEYEAGQAFYWSPGHAPEVLEDVEFVEFSPTEGMNEVIAHITAG